MTIYFVSYDLIRLLSRLQDSLVRCNKLRERNKLEYKIRKPNRKIAQHLIRIATLHLIYNYYFIAIRTLLFNFKSSKWEKFLEISFVTIDFLYFLIVLTLLSYTSQFSHTLLCLDNFLCSKIDWLQGWLSWDWTKFYCFQKKYIIQVLYHFHI
jgi:hypothetical protein